MTNQTGVDLRIERTLEADVSKVFQALTTAEAVAQWYGPSADYEVRVQEWDCRVGGTYKVSLHHKEGNVHTVHGSFKELVPNEKVVYSWDWEDQPQMNSLVTFRLAALGDKTRLELHHAGFPTDDLRDRHTEGWTGAMERLTSRVQPV